LFPVDEVREARVGRAPPADEPRYGHVWPVAALFAVLDEHPTVAVEVGFYPIGELPEPLSPESWTHYRDALDLAPLVGRNSWRSARDNGWRVELGPHTHLSNASRRVQIIIPRPDAHWEATIRAKGSCAVILGSGIGSDEETGAFAIPATAGALTGIYAGSWAVPELSEVPGLHVVPVNSFRSYDPMRPATYVLDTDVLIAMQRFCFTPARLGVRAADVRHLIANLLGRDVLPGPALAQLYQPTRTKIDPRAAFEARAAFESLMSLSRAEIMDEQRALETFDPADERDVASVAEIPQMLWMYAGVLRLRQLWNPAQTLHERAERFEAFVRWLRTGLRLNSALLVQVAFNLWISDGAAQHQASRLLRFRAGPVTDATLGELWGTAYDLFLVGGQMNATQIPDVVDPVILTFDRGLAGMRDFFEHVRLGDLPAMNSYSSYPPNSRVKMNLHPRLGHMESRVAELVAELHSDAVIRLEEADTSVFDPERLSAMIEREERLTKEPPLKGQGSARAP
jgi:hypothetical protein